MSASRFTSAAAGEVLIPVIVTVGVAAYPTPLSVTTKSTIPKLDCSTAAVAAAPAPPPPVMMTNGGVVYPAPALVNTILSIENKPALVVVIATAVAFTLPTPVGAVDMATFGALLYPLPSLLRTISRTYPLFDVFNCAVAVAVLQHLLTAM